MRSQREGLSSLAGFMETDASEIDSALIHVMMWFSFMW
jgi:hypothetical protein